MARKKKSQKNNSTKKTNKNKKAKTPSPLQQNREASYQRAQTSGWFTGTQKPPDPKAFERFYKNFRSLVLQYDHKELENKLKETSDQTSDQTPDQIREAYVQTKVNAFMAFNARWTTNGWVAPEDETKNLEQYTQQFGHYMGDLTSDEVVLWSTAQGREHAEQTGCTLETRPGSHDFALSMLNSMNDFKNSSLFSTQAGLNGWKAISRRYVDVNLNPKDSQDPTDQDTAQERPPKDVQVYMERPPLDLSTVFMSTELVALLQQSHDKNPSTVKSITLNTPKWFSDPQVMQASWNLKQAQPNNSEQKNEAEAAFEKAVAEAKTKASPQLITCETQIQDLKTQILQCKEEQDATQVLLAVTEAQTSVDPINRFASLVGDTSQLSLKHKTLYDDLMAAAQNEETKKETCQQLVKEHSMATWSDFCSAAEGNLSSLNPAVLEALSQAAQAKALSQAAQAKASGPETNKIPDPEQHLEELTRQLLEKEAEHSRLLHDPELWEKNDLKSMVVLRGREGEAITIGDLYEISLYEAEKTLKQGTNEKPGLELEDMPEITSSWSQLLHKLQAGNHEEVFQKQKAVEQWKKARALIKQQQKQQKQEKPRLHAADVFAAMREGQTSVAALPASFGSDPGDPQAYKNLSQPLIFTKGKTNASGDLNNNSGDPNNEPHTPGPSSFSNA